MSLPGSGAYRAQEAAIEEEVGKDNPRAAVAKELRGDRALLGWSQAEVAAHMTGEGVPTTLSAVKAWELGRRIPGRYHARKLAELYGKDWDDVLRWWDTAQQSGDQW